MKHYYFQFLLIGILATLFGCSDSDVPEYSAGTIADKNTNIENNWSSDSTLILYNQVRGEYKNRIRSISLELEKKSGVTLAAKITTLYELIKYATTLPQHFINDNLSSYSHTSPSNYYINKLIEQTSQSDVDFIEEFSEYYFENGGNNIEEIISAIENRPLIIKKYIIIIAATIDAYGIPYTVSYCSPKKVIGDNCLKEACLQVVGDVPEDIIDTVGETLLLYGAPIIGEITGTVLTFSKLLKIAHDYHICEAEKWY